ncbi:MAG: tetratricopeptide repeat protein [Acidobacteriia bacterium]|nr:tetratricopeptide repeat protein [Terriglobia bacterium]
MEEKEYLAIAQDLFKEAYEYQMEGEFETAIELYRRSILAFPTAEAHTFLAWTYSEQGKLDDAIAECKNAIQIDPDFGNPYNDIGAYLIEKSEHEEAIPWLQKAIRAKRYENPHDAHCNLGRSYIALEMFNKAREEFEAACKLKPDHEPAREGLLFLKMLIQ